MKTREALRRHPYHKGIIDENTSLENETRERKVS